MNDRPTPVRLSDPDTWLDQHGDSLYRFALVRVRETALAEDLVQETLLAAWRAKDSFAGGSAERTWLIAILKNKLIDHFRRSNRESPMPEMEDTDEAFGRRNQALAGSVLIQEDRSDPVAISTPSTSTRFTPNSTGKACATNEH